MSGVLDARGRALRDLRISVTDRCNFRCGYCMPRERVTPESFLPRSALLSFEEMTLLARVFVALGVSKLRITGGEPLLRRELHKLIAMLAPLGAELALTTNGVLLPRQAEALRLAGLHRVTVSLDALDAETFQRASDAPGFEPRDVLLGIEAAQRAGFERIKVNCVVRRGVNEGEVLRLAQHFQGSGVVLRFIEFMEVGTRNAWQASEVVSKDEILSLLAPLGNVTAVPRARQSDVAERYVLPGLEVGIIASVTAPFCGDCSRARVAADGHLYSCLFASSGTDLRGPLRAGASTEQMEQMLRALWSQRDDRFSELAAELARAEPDANSSASGSRHLPVVDGRVEMSFIGG